MKKNVKQILILIIVSSLLLVLSAPSVISYEQNDRNQLVKVKVWNIIDGEDTICYISFDEFQDLFEIMNEKIAAGSFSQQMLEKLDFLEDHGMISDGTVKKLSLQYRLTEERSNKFSRLTQADVTAFNIFSGTFFGMKGEMEISFLNLEITRLPFFDGNITAGFLGYGKFTGNGSVFTIGFAGLKYIYDYDNIKYGFPYFPVISGSIIGFSGILIEVFVHGDNVPSDVEGHYLFGMGTSVFTYWKVQ